MVLGIIMSQSDNSWYTFSYLGNVNTLHSLLWNIKELITDNTFSFSFDPWNNSSDVICMHPHFGAQRPSHSHLCVSLPQAFLLLALFCICMKTYNFLHEVIYNVENKCLTYLAISHTIDFYMVFSFIFSYWNLNMLEM